MGQPKTIRFENDLQPKIEAYLKQNPNLKLAKLVNLAVEKFIQEPHSIELVPIDLKTWEIMAQQAFKKHKKAMDELK
jgi:hypothetical protein